MFQLKRLSHDAVPAALEKAMRYRLLNEPMEAESICRDVLEVEPDNQEALTTLVLALSDQFPEHLGPAFHEAQELVKRLATDYERAYYAGIICERRGKAHLGQQTIDHGGHAYDWYRKAMAHYEQAEKLRPAENDDALLRWNTCARTLMNYPEVQPTEDRPSSPIDLE